jgi:hypothetical protein
MLSCPRGRGHKILGAKIGLTRWAVSRAWPQNWGIGGKSLEYRKIAELKKLPNNPRIVKDRAFRDLCQSLRDNPGFFEARPLILSDRTGELIILAGNTKYEAARVNKMKTVPTELLSGLTEAQEREIIIRDNAHAGTWDYDILANTFDDLPLAEWGVELPKMGPLDPELEDINFKEDKKEKGSITITCMISDRDMVIKRLNDMSNEYEGFNVYV